MKHALLFACICIHIIGLLSFQVEAEETVLHRFSAQDRDREFEKLLYLSAGVEFTNRGISSTKEEKKPDYVLLAEYSLKEAEAEVTYNFSKTDTAQRPVQHTFVLSIDHDINTQIAEAVQVILKKADIKPHSSNKARIKGLLPPLSMSTPTDKAAPPTDTTPSGPQKENTYTNKAKALKTRFNVAFSTAGLMLFGKVTEYFHYGAAGTLSAGFMYMHPGWSINAGVKTSLIRVFNDKNVTGGPLYITTTGADFQIGTGIDTPFRAGARVSGGAAILTVAGDEESLSKSVPYLDFGVYSTIPLGRKFYLGGELLFLMIFDTDVVIMGASPAITVRWEF